MVRYIYIFSHDDVKTYGGCKNVFYFSFHADGLTKLQKIGKVHFSLQINTQLAFQLCLTLLRSRMDTCVILSKSLFRAEIVKEPRDSQGLSMHLSTAPHISELFCDSVF